MVKKKKPFPVWKFFSWIFCVGSMFFAMAFLSNFYHGISQSPSTWFQYYWNMPWTQFRNESLINFIVGSCVWIRDV